MTAERVLDIITVGIGIAAMMFAWPFVKAIVGVAQAVVIFGAAVGGN